MVKNLNAEVAEARREPVACRCGRAPERNTTVRSYQFSLSCKCGGDEINFLARSNDEEKIVETWRSLILRAPFKHYIQHIPDPDADVYLPPTEYHDPDPLRRYIRAHGGHCSGGGGAC